MKYLVQPLAPKSANAPSTENIRRHYSIASPTSSLAITPAGLDSRQKPWSESDNQIFRFTPVDGPWMRIDVVGSRKVLDINGADTASGAKLIEYDWHGRHNQQFRLHPVKNGLYQIEARHSGLVLDAGTALDGTEIVQKPRTTANSQKWVISEIRPASVLFDPKATIYQHNNYRGKSQALGLGSFDIHSLGIGNDQVSSVKVPEGTRVTLYEHANFRGRKKQLIKNTPSLPDFNDIVSGILVEKVASVYQHANYRGKRLDLGVGRYTFAQIDAGIGNDQLSSITVPQGLMVTLYEDANFKGDFITFFENDAFVPTNWNDRVSSIVVKNMGLVIPPDAIRFGGKIALKGAHGKFLVAEQDGSLNANRAAVGSWERFTIVRSGATLNTVYLSYGDTISLKSTHGKYVAAESDGRANANRDSIGSWEKFLVVRSGATESQTFVSNTDVISLKSVHNRFFAAESDGKANANRERIGSWERFVVSHYDPPAVSGNPLAPPGTCGAESCGAATSGASACGAAACGAAACGADACGAAACGAAASIVNACAAAAAGIAVCGGNVAGVGVCGAAAVGAGVCGAAACGAAAVGATACGADACGAAACGAAACGAAACGAEACGAAASGTGACAANACSADAGGIDACPADVCAANVCGINACPADACAADACALDIVPILPGI